MKQVLVIFCFKYMLRRGWQYEFKLKLVVQIILENYTFFKVLNTMKLNPKNFLRSPQPMKHWPQNAINKAKTEISDLHRISKLKGTSKATYCPVSPWNPFSTSLQLITSSSLTIPSDSQFFTNFRNLFSIFFFSLILFIC